MLNYIGLNCFMESKLDGYVEWAVCLLVAVHGDCMVVLCAYMAIWLYSHTKMIMKH